MKASFALVAAVASTLAPLSAASPVAEARHLTTNPFAGKHFFVSPVYAKEIAGGIKTILQKGDLKLAAKALEVATVPTFIWISNQSDVPSVSTYLTEAYILQKLTGKSQVVTFVVYDLPDRDCSAGASAGEFIIADGGEAKYRAFIDSIVAQIAKVPQVQVVIELEPDSIGNIVTNQAVPKCGNAAPVYERSISYAIAHLSKLPNVAIYVDAAHGGWLGWPGNIGPTATLLGGLLKNATAIYPGAWVRGVGTNVSNYNGLGNQNQTGYDELVYHRNLAPLLTAAGYPAHFIVDQGRSGQQGYPRTGSDWCNNKYAGFGFRPSTNTPDPIIDAIVWVKPGGEGDGTSDPTAARYDPTCGANNTYAKVPAPEAGAWFEAYFEQLIELANPPF